MSGTLLIRGARQLLTLHGPTECRRGSALRELGLIRDGAMLIEDGRIVEVGPGRRIENLAQARRAQEIDATGRVVMPGFVDCHTHLVWGAAWLDAYEARITGAGEGVGPGPESTRRVLRSASVRRLESRARQFVNGMVRHGTTTAEGKSGYGFDEKSELKMLRVQERLDGTPLDVTSTFLTAPHLPETSERGRAGYFSQVSSEFLATIRRRRLARFAGLRCCEHAGEIEQGRLYLNAARELGFEIKIHASGRQPSLAVRLAAEVGAASVDGLCEVTGEEVSVLARTNAVAVLLPGTVFHDPHARCAGARDLIDGGAAVALATNFNPGTSPTYSMQTIIALACAYLRMTPAEAISTATINAAWATRVAHKAGSLEAGKSADVLVLNAADYREIPYHFGVNLVHRTVKRGVTVYQEGSVAGR